MPLHTLDRAGLTAHIMALHPECGQGRRSRRLSSSARDIGHEGELMAGTLRMGVPPHGGLVMLFGL